jgi:hypothetical protein
VVVGIWICNGDRGNNYFRPKNGASGAWLRHLRWIRYEALDRMLRSEAKFMQRSSLNRADYVYKMK